MRYANIILLIVIVALVALFAVMSALNSEIVTEVSVRIKEGAKERMDPSLLGLNRKHELPDYKVKINASKRFFDVDLGTKLDTSAKDWLVWPVRDVIPMRELQEVIVLDDDKTANDLLDRIQITGELSTGASFECRLSSRKSFDAGMSWFFATPVGKAILTGIIVLVILSGSRLIFRW